MTGTFPAGERGAALRSISLRALWLGIGALVGALLTGSLTFGDWNTVTAVSAAIAAVAATAAVILTFLMQRERRSLLALERRRGFYTQWIVAPTIEALERYRKEVRQLLQSGRQNVQALVDAKARHEEVVGLVRSLSEECDTCYFDLQNTVTIGADAWEDRSLRNELRCAIEELQDELNSAIETLAIEVRRPEFDKTLNSSVARMTRLLMDHDPKPKA